MYKLSPELIQRAHTGSTAGLEELARFLTAENYTPAVLDAGLAQLNINSCPKHPSLIKPDVFHRVISAIQVVDKSLRVCLRMTEHKAAASLCLQENLYGLVAWMSLIFQQVDSSRTYRCVGLTLLHLIYLDDGLSLFVFSSPEAVDLVLKLWIYEPKINDETSAYLNTPWVPSATALVHHWVTHREANQIFYDTVLSSKRQLSMFLDALLFKLRRLAGKLDKHADSLAAIFIHLERRAVSLGARRRLCLKELATVKSIIRPPIITIDDFLENSVFMFQVARAHRNFGPIIESGFLQALVDVFPNCEWEGVAQTSQGTWIMAMIASIACHPQGLQGLNSAMSNLLVSPKLASKYNPWRCLANSVEQKLHIIPSLTLDILICDGLSCQRSIPPGASLLPLKVCSGCHFMAYCSVVCQKADWAARHRFECPELRYVSQRRQDAVRISQRTKAFHLSLATQIFHDVKFQEFCNRYIGSSHCDVQNLVVTHNMLFPEYPRKTLNIHSWDEWLEHQPQAGVWPAMESRLSSFVQEMRAGVLKQNYSGISALELALDWNNESYLSLLVRFKEASEGRFVPTRSILRVL
ncbi:hypothetical protein BKA70DRAFT_1268858 [Coprinopsis sp. MPI-PUGE-AT-0042]|nr:hypothetical protein BKA70DRAFT_1268858 [Coprinopsis sp. MPI-PUGE-AT-0042]